MTDPTPFPRAMGKIDPATREQSGWPIQPVIDHLTKRLGEYHHHENPTGYCSAAAELYTGIHRTTWQRYVKRGYLDATQADKVATSLGLHPRALWPTYDTALNPDHAFLDGWDSERRAPRANSATGTVVGCVHGVWSAMVEQLEEDAPTYDWCEATWREVRADAPPPGDLLPPWLLDQLTRRWAMVMLAELQG